MTYTAMQATTRLKRLWNNCIIFLQISLQHAQILEATRPILTSCSEHIVKEKQGMWFLSRQSKMVVEILWSRHQDFQLAKGTVHKKNPVAKLW